MGCGGSKNDVKQDNNTDGKHKNIENPHVNNNHHEDDEVQVVDSGKVIKKNKLDEITDNTKVNQTIEKPIPKKTEPAENNSIKLKSATIGIEHSEEIKSSENPKNELRSVTIGKLEFESHPHEFDFSFIEEKTKTQHETDALTDKILQEISEVN